MESTNNPKLVQDGPEWYETGLAYRYQMPDDPGPYPTAVLVHGRQGNEDKLWVFRRAVPRPWLVVAPRAPLAENGLYSWLVEPGGAWPDLATMKPAVDSLTRFLRAIPPLYNADPDRIYLMGFSQGAAVSIATALTHPNLIRGVAGLVGFAPVAADDEIAGRLDGMPVFLASGTQDQTVPYEVTRQMVDLLQRAGADLDYHEYPIGHKMPAAGVHTLREWFNARV